MIKSVNCRVLFYTDSCSPTYSEKKRKILVKQRNSWDRESIQLWPHEANVCIFKSCCPAQVSFWQKEHTLSWHRCEILSRRTTAVVPEESTGPVLAGGTVEGIPWHLKLYSCVSADWEVTLCIRIANYRISFKILCIFQQGLVEKQPTIWSILTFRGM